MNPNTIREMDAPTRQKFHFANSSFSRMYGPDKVTGEMIDFCIAWAESNQQAPLDDLTNVDIYFRNLWNNRWT